MTTISEARVSIANRFLTNWASQTPVVLANEDEESPTDLDASNAPWVRLTVQELASRQETLAAVGARKVRRRGNAIVQIYTPRGNGTNPADLLVNSARAIFELVKFDGLDFETATERSRTPTDKWYRPVVESLFTFEEIK